jgi:hypothetical protein
MQTSSIITIPHVLSLSMPMPPFWSTSATSRNIVTLIPLHSTTTAATFVLSSSSSRLTLHRHHPHARPLAPCDPLCTQDNIWPCSVLTHPSVPSFSLPIPHAPSFIELHCHYMIAFIPQSTTQYDLSSRGCKDVCTHKSCCESWVAIDVHECAASVEI